MNSCVTGLGSLVDRCSSCLFLLGLCILFSCPDATAAVQVVDIQVNSGSDDAEEGNSSVSLASSDLELTIDKGVNQTIGLRFNNVSLPNGAYISKSYIQFQADGTDSTATTLTIKGEASDNAQTFSSTGSDVTSRPRTGASIIWMPPAWLTVDVAGVDQRTPDISAVIQEIIDRENWTSGNSLVLIINGDGNAKRRAKSYNGDVAGAPVLHIEYGATPGNEQPSANAGQDRSLIFPSDSLCLKGTASDDGIPGGLSVNWMQKSGPASTVLETPAASTTTVTFPIAGKYNMTFQASDGELTTEDDLLVTIGRRIEVPADAPTVQQAVDLANDGDLIVLAPGIYTESILIQGKSVTIASYFIDTGDRSFIDQTVIDGADAFDVVRVDSNISGMTRFIGITVRNAINGITGYSPFSVLSCRVTDTSDGIDFERGATGVVVRDSIIDLNKDDAIDFDSTSWGIIENNWLINNGDDGIEIRTPSNIEAEIAQYIIRDNIITGNGEDGIQIIGHNDGPSNREFIVYGNLIGENLAAGVSYMCCSQTTELFEGASIPEKMVIYNNTFRNNSHGLIGGDDVVALNNIFVGHDVALKHMQLDSIAAHNMFFGNTTDFLDVSVLPNTDSFVDPQLASDGVPGANSPAIDAGITQFTWNNVSVLDLASPANYTGPLPDLGAFETPVNKAPVITAGEDQFLTWSTDPVQLSGIISDDGLPVPPGALTIAWAQVSGPCGIVVTDVGAPATTATFPQPGIYSLRLSAYDGELFRDDIVMIEILPEAPPVDTDGDGIVDSIDTDDDNDGLPDIVEDSNGNGIVDAGETDPLDADSDNDGLTDGVEDSNGNGIVDAGETDPLDSDSDNDGALDGEEDSNSNGVVDAGEADPLNFDSDGDGLTDGYEINVGGTDPSSSTTVYINPGDMDNDGDVDLGDLLLHQRIILGL